MKKGFKHFYVIKQRCWVRNTHQDSRKILEAQLTYQQAHVHFPIYMFENVIKKAKLHYEEYLCSAPLMCIY